MRWELVFSFIMAGLLTLASVIAFAVVLHFRTAAWRYWLYGAAVFIVFQGILRLPWLIALEVLLRDTLRASTSLSIGFTAFAALTAGSFERGGQWLLFQRFIKPEERTAKMALMVGAGHGGIEALLIGIFIALQAVGYIVVQTLPIEAMKGKEQAIAQAKALFAQLAWWLPFMGMWERLCAQVSQIAMTVMVWKSFFSHRGWFWSAVLAHTVLDFSAALTHRYAQKWLGMNFGTLLTEGFISLYAAALTWLAWRLIRTERRERSDELP